MKSIKLTRIVKYVRFSDNLINLRFESLVNLNGCKTKMMNAIVELLFESLVNLNGCKTVSASCVYSSTFESLVNLNGCKTRGKV